MEGGKQVQAGAAWAAGLGQALVVVSLAAGARVARWAEAVEGAGGVEAGAAMFAGTGSLMGWEERRAESTEARAGRTRRLESREGVGAVCGDGTDQGRGLCVYNGG